MEEVEKRKEHLECGCRGNREITDEKGRGEKDAQEEMGESKQDHRGTDCGCSPAGVEDFRVPRGCIHHHPNPRLVKVRAGERPETQRGNVR